VVPGSKGVPRQAALGKQWRWKSAGAWRLAVDRYRQAVWANFARRCWLVRQAAVHQVTSCLYCF